MYKYKNLQAGQLPQEHLPFLQNLLNFIITKYLKQEVDGNLSICMDEGSPMWLLYNWKYKELSMSCDQKVMTLPPMEKCPINFYHRVAFYCPNLITVAPLDKEIKK